MAKDTVTVEGFVAKDTERRDAGSHTITTVTIPVEQGRMKDGQWVPDTDRDTGAKIVRWWEAEFWNEHGDAVAQTVSKGVLVTVTGEPRPQVFIKKDGTPGMGLRIANGQIAVITRRPSRNAGSNASASGSGMSGQGGSFGGSQGDGWANPGQAFNESQAPF